MLPWNKSRRGTSETMMTMSTEGSLEAKYMAEDASSKKFLVSNFTNYKMTDSRLVMEQYNELLDFKHTLKHQKEELTRVKLGSHLCIEKSLRLQDNDKPKDNNVSDPSVVNMVEHNNYSRKPRHLKKDCKGRKVGNKANSSDTNGLADGSTNSLKGATVHSVGVIHEMTAPYTPQQNGISKRKNKVLKEMVNFMLSYSGLRFRVVWTVVRLHDLKLKTLGERGIECIFVGYAKHSKAFRFYVIEPNESVSINLIIESIDAIFDKNRFSSFPRPSLRIPNGIKDIGDSVVPEEVTKEVVTQQPESELTKIKKE
ncbi:zinc finger, CCHC-type containing protein [Tanacetum coccineum]